jgi:pectate lyase-like protein
MNHHQRHDNEILETFTITNRILTTLVALVALGLPCASLNAAESAPGDRNFPINQVYPQDVFYHNGKGGRVLDITKPPFNAKGDGVTDDTQALIAAMRFVREHYEPLVGEGVGSVAGQKWGSTCSRKLHGTWIIYLPDGEYVVSDTVSQGWPARAINILDGWWNINRLLVNSAEHEKELDPDHYTRGRFSDAVVYAEENYYIQIVGQSRAKTIIRLKDSSPGYGEGSEKAVVAFYLLQRGSNINAGNFIQNVTIQTGKDNPGAVGLKWNASNWGGIRNLAIRSADGRGRAGLMMARNNALGYHHDIVVDGFDVGIELAAGKETAVALEYATLSHQRETAIRVGGGLRDSLSARKILVNHAPVALRAGPAAQVVLLESRLNSSHANGTALVLEHDAHLFVRSIDLSGYKGAVVKQGRLVLDTEFIDEYVSAEPVSLRKNAPARSLRLPVKDSPLILPEQDLSKWASVNDFGAVGDGKTDDTAAIQRAMKSGKPVVFFPKASYVINGTVDIPATVREVSFLWASIYRSEANEPDGPGLFRVAEASGQPLMLHATVNAGGVFLDHEADRPVVLQDVIAWFHHCRNYATGPDMLFPGRVAQNTGIWRLYRNTRPAGAAKEVFANNALFFAAGGAEGDLAVENVRAWVRMGNNEHVPGAQFAFRRSDAWIFGFKSENADTLFQAADRSRLEVLGGTFLNWGPRKGPAIVSRDSVVSVTFFMWTVAPETILQDETNGVVTTLPVTRFPMFDSNKVDGGANDVVVPLLVNSAPVASTGAAGAAGTLPATQR